MSCVISFIMTYSYDMKERAVSYVRSGGLQTEASQIFGVTTRTIQRWLCREDLMPRPAKSRHRKLDKAALYQHVRDYPDALLRERAAHFGVHVNAIWVALRRMNIVKKNDTLR